MTGPPPYRNLEWQPPPPPRTSGEAIASLILGVAGLSACPLLCSIIGLVVGYRARGAIRRSNGQIEGSGLALAGIICSWAGVAIYGGIILFVVVVGILEN